MENLINDNNLKKFRKQINILDKFTTDLEWEYTLKYDMLINKKISNDITNYINIINLDNIENIMIEIKNKSIISKDKALNENDIVKKWYLFRESYAYYGFLEVIIEGSIITNKILDLFKEKYKDKYLDVLKKVDNINPSKLTNFSKSYGEYNGKEIELYLLMKKWQDIEHLYHNNELIKPHDEAKYNFNKFIYKNYPYLKDIKGRDLLGIYLLNKKPIIEYEDIFKFFDIGIIDKLSYIIGGKNLGLAKLQYNNISIPKAYAISVDSILNKNYINKLNILNDKCNYSIRSSATVEDNKKYSFAGMFKTILNVEIKDIYKGIDEVSLSINSDRVKEYSKRFNTNKPYMSVVIQEFKEPEYSGVWIGNSLNSGHLEWTSGNGEKLVSGKIVPKYENWNEEVINPFKINNIIVRKKCIELQKKLNVVSDFEWCVVDNKLLFVQFRPVTIKFKNKNEEINKINNLIKGIPASSGIYEGKLEYLEEIEDINKFKEGDILLTDYTDPDWVPAMIKSGAVVTAEGGFLSHSAIISRELGIPCVVGIGYDNIKNLSNHTNILVDGNNGIIKIIK